MNFDGVEKIANAVLYEGYMLYPYRRSSTKNQQRWNFGTLYPQAFAEAQKPAESFRFIAECLLNSAQDSTLDVRFRFLQISEAAAASEHDVDRVADVCNIRVADLLAAPQEHDLRTGADQELSAHLQIGVHPTSSGAAKLHIELANVTPLNGSRTREAVLPFSCTSAHLLVGIAGGEFISLLDPPPWCQADAAECHNVGVFPVLAGEAGVRNTMLCSPIILYDYPQVAPESAGDFFDATEMDEMLSLRVLTLTEEEKQQMRQADPRTRSILERTETLPPEQMMKLHGAIRALRRVQKAEEQS